MLDQGSLTYEEPDRAGKSHGRTDTYRGRFVALVPGELVNEVGWREALARLAALVE
jgi:hypothetical protein